MKNRGGHELGEGCFDLRQVRANANAALAGFRARTVADYTALGLIDMSSDSDPMGSMIAVVASVFYVTVVASVCAWAALGRGFLRLSAANSDLAGERGGGRWRC
jgi:hypothetical protein